MLRSTADCLFKFVVTDDQGKTGCQAAGLFHLGLEAAAAVIHGCLQAVLAQLVDEELAVPGSLLPQGRNKNIQSGRAVCSCSPSCCCISRMSRSMPMAKPMPDRLRAAKLFDQPVIPSTRPDSGLGAKIGRR